MCISKLEGRICFLNILFITHQNNDTSLAIKRGGAAQMGCCNASFQGYQTHRTQDRFWIKEFLSHFHHILSRSSMSVLFVTRRKREGKSKPNH